jgi:hypothetical protein
MGFDWLKKLFGGSKKEEEQPMAKPEGEAPAEQTQEEPSSEEPKNEAGM